MWFWQVVDHYEAASDDGSGNHPTLYTLHTTLYTLHTAPFTLHPTPSTWWTTTAELRTTDQAQPLRIFFRSSQKKLYHSILSLYRHSDNRIVGGFGEIRSRTMDQATLHPPLPTHELRNLRLEKTSRNIKFAKRSPKAEARHPKTNPEFRKTKTRNQKNEN